METVVEKRACKECGEKLLGRTDQKYCSAMCKTAWNNRKKAEETRCIPECVTIVQKALLNNYKILSTLRKKGEQFSLLYLEDLGFSFRHLTAVTEQEGQLKRHCFNESYILTDQAVILLND